MAVDWRSKKRFAMLPALFTPRNRIRTLLLLAACGVLAAAAVTVGIDDNPLGVALVFLSATALVLAFVHPWRTSSQFRRLVLASFLVFVAFAVLSNVFEGVASKMSVQSTFASLLDSAGAVCFLIASLLCPAALIVGVIGVVVASRRERHSQSNGGLKIGRQ
jgi:hypothetical protein